MTELITPKYVIKIIEATINFLDINLVEENLSPNSEMERVDTVDRLNTLIENLSLVTTFTASTSDTKAAKTCKDRTVSAAIATKLPCVPVDNPNSPVVDTLLSKLKVLTKCSIAELKENADHCGVLRKYKKQLLSKWNRRFCILRDGILLYFQSETDTKGKGYIILGGYKFVIPPNSNGFIFNLESHDKSTIYQFQADQKKDIAIWKEHLLKATNKEYTDHDLQTVLSIMKDASETNENNYRDSVSPPLAEENNEVAAHPAEEEIYGDVIPSTDEYYGDVAAPERIEYYGDVAPPNTVPAALYVSDEYYGDVAPTQTFVQPSDDNYYGDVADPASLASDELYEEVGSGNVNGWTVPVLQPHIPSNLPGVGDFSTDNIYIGAHDCIGDGPQDLSFNRGDIMYIMEKIDFNWWMAFLNGKVGLVPSNFLTEAFAS